MACVVLLLFSGCLPSQDKSVGIICLGLESLIPIMSTRVLYKQLGEVGGVLRLTSASQLYLHSISAKKKIKKSQSPFYPAIASIASEWLTTKPLCKHRLSTSARRPPYAHTRLAYAQQHTLPHTLCCSFALKLSHSSSHPYLHF